MSALRKFSSQAEPEILEALQEIATREGRQFQAVLGDAMREYLTRRNQQARDEMCSKLSGELKERDELYRSLAK